jgi:hypothetical protein
MVSALNARRVNSSVRRAILDGCQNQVKHVALKVGKFLLDYVK